MPEEKRMVNDEHLQKVLLQALLFQKLHFSLPMLAFQYDQLNEIKYSERQAQAFVFFKRQAYQTEGNEDSIGS